DTVMEELTAIANESDLENWDLAIAMAIYMLGFSTYTGFTK
ncbi:MAG TPA: Eco47II family restriction endonuclease, partial [Clostridiales bacterium]|nr:Eco47II family restriction endonuclease [Clostridiales bacterium]